jgi:arylsulfatase A-like enzyme
MRKLLSIILLAVGMLHSNAQRNVVLIIADDIGKDYCDFYPDHGTNTVNFTNVKRLLTRGVVFNNAWSNPLCSPTRAGILTGRYSFRTGVGDVVDGSNPKLSLTENIIPKVLNVFSPDGISKACVGKWHVTTGNAVGYSYPTVMGFDHYEGNLVGGLGNSINGYNSWTKITNGVNSTCTNYATTENVNNAIAYINGQPTSKPFYLQLAFNAPHTPYHLPPLNLISPTSLTGTSADVAANPLPYFQAMAEAMDNEIGRFFDYLITTGKWDNTDIIFIGDNGDENTVAQSSPSKGSVYQGGISIPFIISGPDIVNPNRTSDALVNTVDLFATIQELFGNINWQSQIPTTIVDSKSIVPILSNTATSIRSWAFSEVFRVTPLASDGKAIRNLEYKLIKFANGTERLFNLLLDPSESNNLLTATMTANDVSNYNYLCSEMVTLVGSGITCTTLVSDSFNTSYNEMNVIGNPFQSKINIKGITAEDEFEVYSIKGESIYKGNDLSTKDFTYLSNGIYFVKLIAQKKTFKVIKE